MPNSEAEKDDGAGAAAFEYSKNERAEKLMGNRLQPGQEHVLFFDFPCELGYWCPTCKIEWDETLIWSEYNGFIWCERCNFDWPSALCVNLDAAPDPKHDWKKAGRESAVSVFLDTVEQAVNRSLDAAPSPAPTDTKETTHD